MEIMNWLDRSEHKAMRPFSGAIECQVHVAETLVVRAPGRAASIGGESL
jgi:hypothetical protein